ncbi:transcriptional repressor [Thermaerobacter sp. PB12/4term]|uniref:Fur family transcriptional regulator n=1 Tax=Thermaerobacter sp. PB12/4term TaxID=2293838 RepID=UPI0013145C91|nr:transcriptional repressor [Thermaerobacter sp. PB12/4term]QIA27400.1 transcriptional repressor [Thermaerobacter sp. PB12/4term]
MARQRAWQQLARRLRRAGQRPTIQRVAVYEALLRAARAGIHPTADEVHATLRPSLPTLSPVTTRRVLAALVEAGLARRVVMPGEPDRYDGDPAPHAHLACVRCHRLQDVALPELDEIVRQVREQTGFLITGQELVLEGLCRHCRHGRPSPPAAAGSPEAPGG